MALYYVASIPPVAYPAFFDLCDSRLPPTFEDWEIAQTLARRHLVMSGHHVVGLPLDPIDFRGYCRSMRCRADAASLAACATLRGNEQFGTEADYEALRARIVVVEDTRAYGRAPIDRTVAPRRHWWQFWRRPAPVVMAERPLAGAAYAPATTADEVVLDPPPRQHWWEIWRRPQTARIVERHRSVYDRAA